ncbi:hypothetical protein BDY21DRAFT_392520 [Lineolata rhizophorae]|uniref:25S rRNA (uridine-N(3))-methyltransferase BMT5-like domain-containing protein n=1 Tax=Lineolata rhizophorae TaxID=578093 RepID=A0A6A6NZZ7_9PEZI|nr:hypothetical protein BDY21DRAFT_392520 [Lineolata rhizophorae]
MGKAKRRRNAEEAKAKAKKAAGLGPHGKSRLLGDGARVGKHVPAAASGNAKVSRPVQGKKNQGTTKGQCRGNAAPRHNGDAKPWESNDDDDYERLQLGAHPIPFDPYKKVLLVGEGDFSFALSLVRHHGLSSLLSTSHDTLPTLQAKYAPQIGGTLSGLRSALGPSSLLHGIDARRLPSYKPLRAAAPFHRIAFNFPHLGGRAPGAAARAATDVNYQVRRHQALLVDFLAGARRLVEADRSGEAEAGVLGPARGGRVLVTLFEGEPYGLWNVRDLARSVGLKVVGSERFEAGWYEGYRHARTMGNVRRKERGRGGGEEKGSGDEEEREETGAKDEHVREAGESGNDESAEEEDEDVEDDSRPGWHGEKRPARTYYFANVDSTSAPQGQPKAKKRRRGDDTSSDSD